MSLRRGWRALCLCMLGMAACLEAIPEPSECREPEQVIAGEQCLACPIEPEHRWTNSCVTEARSGAAVGTLGKREEWERFSCLLGEANAELCNCTVEPSPAPTCFSSSCPPFVTQSVGDAAQCIRGGLQATILPAFRQLRTPGATCGCANALLACDGKGLAFGGLTDVDTYVDLGSVAIELPQDQLPSTGRLGVYIRMRGFAVPTVVLITDRNQLRQSGFAFYSIGDFEESIGFGPKDGGFPIFDTESRAYEWSRVEDKPTLISVAPLPLEGGDAFHLSEIDCVIPFVVPE